jgi:hypothetical protein
MFAMNLNFFNNLRTMKRTFILSLLVLFALGCQKDSTENHNQVNSQTSPSTHTFKGGDGFPVNRVAANYSDYTQTGIVQFDLQYNANGTTTISMTSSYLKQISATTVDYSIVYTSGVKLVDFGYQNIDYQVNYVLPPGTWQILAFFQGGSYDQDFGTSNTFVIQAQPTAPNSFVAPLYRYFNAVTGKHLYTNTWNTYGSNSVGYAFEKVQGYMYSIASDPITLNMINPTPDNLIALFNYYNASTNDYLLSTSPTTPSGYAYKGALGYISSTSISNFNVPLSEYYSSSYGYIYTSPPETLSSSYSLIALTGYLLTESAPIYGNAAVSENFEKANCQSGYVGPTLTETIPANTFFSNVQSDANAQALNYLNENGQADANSQSISTCVPIAPQPPINNYITFTASNKTTGGFTLSFVPTSGSSTTVSLSPSTNNFTTQLPPGTYTLSISPSGTPVSAIFNLGSRASVTGAGAVFSSVNISSGSSDLVLIID